MDREPLTGQAIVNVLPSGAGPAELVQAVEDIGFSAYFIDKSNGIVSYDGEERAAVSPAGNTDLAIR